MIYFSTISEPVLETLVYLFLAGGAIAITGLIAYATVVFRRVATAVEAATGVMLRATELLDCACQTLTAVETKLGTTQPSACLLSTARLDALDHAMSRAATAAKEEPKGACPKCGGAFEWPPRGSTLTDTAVTLTMLCGACKTPTDIVTKAQPA